MVRRRSCRRGGNVLVLTAFLMVGLMAVIAFAVDLGVISIARTELQRSADAAALAAAWDLIDENSLSGSGNLTLVQQNAANTASNYAGFNTVLAKNPSLPVDDVKFGFMANPSDPHSAFQSSFDYPNAIRVTVRRSADTNGEVPFFFAKALGFDKMAVEATATAAILTSIGGFKIPSNGGNVEMLPFALDVDTWNNMLAGNATDNYKWNAIDGVVESGSDGVLEVNLYPQGTGSPGNRGTVDVGSSNNSTNDIARQIVSGVNSQDLSYHGGKLEFDDNGEMFLNGDTGISAGVKDELASIKGKPRMIPLFSSVCDNGNNANYTCVKLVGIRIMHVKLTGGMSSKQVIVQPAIVKMRGGIPSPSTHTSDFVFSPAWLVK